MEKSTDAVDLYQRMKVAEHASDRMATDLAVALRTIKVQRVRIDGLEVNVSVAAKLIENGDYAGGLHMLKELLATVRSR